MICASVGLYDVNCTLLDEPFSILMFRGLGNGLVTPEFMFLSVADSRGCVTDLEDPPEGSAFYYLAQISDSTANLIPPCAGSE